MRTEVDTDLSSAKIEDVLLLAIFIEALKGFCESSKELSNNLFKKRVDI